MNFAELVQQVATRPKLPSPDARRRIRKRAGLPLRAMAEVVDVDTSTVQRWEAGKSSPRGEHLARYAELLKVLEQVAS